MLDENTWRTLMVPALVVIDSLHANGHGTLDFRLGGGTVLMFWFGHRISKDIDIFTHDAQALSYITPRLNDVAERVSTSYEEQANVVKLLLPGGDINFIVAAPVIPGASAAPFDFGGRTILLDTTAEILAKKLLYRAGSFKARDVFDMVTASSLDRASAVAALRVTSNTRQVLRARLAAMAAVPQADLLAGIVLTEAGRHHAANMVARLQDAIEDVDGSPPSGQSGSA